MDVEEELKYLARQAEGVGDTRAVVIFWRALEQLGHRRPDHVPNYEPQPAGEIEQQSAGAPAPEQPKTEPEPAKEPEQPKPEQPEQPKEPEASKEPAKEPEPEKEPEMPAAFNKMLQLARGDTRKAVRAIIQDNDLPDAVKTAKIKALLNKQP